VEKELHDLMAYDGLKIYQNKNCLSFSIDSVLLADFVKITPRIKNIMDFGTGFGPIPLFLSIRSKAKMVGIDLLAEVCEYATESVKYNHLEDQITIKNVDIMMAHEMFPTSFFDIITCNPPFFKVSDEKVLNDKDAFTMARHETHLTLENMIVQAKKMLSTGGSLVFIHRVDRLEEIILLLEKHRFAIKRMRYVYPKVGKKALMVLIDAKSNGKTGSMELYEPLYIYDSFGEYTDEIKRIFHTKRS